MGEDNYTKALKKFDELNTEANLEILLDNTYKSKKELLNFFWYKKYKDIKNLSEVNEFDFVETLYKNYQRSRRFGQVGGFAFSMMTWDTVFKRLSPLTKLMIGGIICYYGGELSLYYHIDYYYKPLSQIFNRKYRPQIEKYNQKKRSLMKENEG
ncbi:unnamed protein product [Blepharisma stoltei]|uniref:Uncharacterized protein n=1 Tax=Blepharisma stoltei TaxID=1481888 RepID=A0AAU9J7U3_9CILI|nr:unnamed protein product [Blepharisma stoltei]